MRKKLVLLSCFAFCITGSAQQPVHQFSQEVPSTLSVNVSRVNVLFTVDAGRGKFVTNLRKDDFKVFEDDRLQSITNFTTESDLPLNIALLIDTSGSTRGKLHYEKEAAEQFFKSALQSGKDKAFVMGFDNVVNLLQDYADDPQILAASMGKIISGGSTSLYDAISQAVTHKLSVQQGRRVIVILSDGMDNSSHVSLTQALEIAQRNDTIIYAVSTNRFEGFIWPDQKVGDANLERLAIETGGRALFPSKVQDLSTAFRRINDELRSQYSLAYSPSNTSRDGTYRQIRVVPSQKRFKVRCRNGYFAPSQRM
jgi:Ca-activated chloride channel family protein